MTEPDTPTPDATPTAPPGAVDVLALEPLPYRVVTAADWGWHQTPTKHDLDRYVRDYQTGPGGARPDALPLAELVAAHGPERPVIGMEDGERERLLRALVLAERRALLSVLVALHRLARARVLARKPAPAGTYGHPLLGGRGGSNEAEHLVGALAWVGGTNYASSRVDGGVVDVVELIVGRWLDNPKGYVEIAGNLSHLVGAAADLAEGREGLATVGDSHLCRPGAVPRSVRAWALGLSADHYAAAE